MGCGGRRSQYGKGQCHKGGLAVCVTREGKKILCNHQTHAAMCRTCRAWDRQRDRCMAVVCGPGGGCRCSRDGVPCKKRIADGECPLGRAPDSRGRVTLNGRRYRGVPMRLRLLLWWRGELPGVDHLAGCGCDDSWKRAAVRVRWWWRGVWRRARPG